MNQQIDIKLTLSVNAELSKEEIHNRITDMINFPSWEDITEINIVEIKEEAEIYDVELIDHNTKIAEAKAFLKSAGYFTDNLWTIDDVKGKLKGGIIKLTDENAQNILSDSLQNEATMEQIWFSISEFGRINYNLETVD